jgi:hypothetical protein
MGTGAPGAAEVGRKTTKKRKKKVFEFLKIFASALVLFRLLLFGA